MTVPDYSATIIAHFVSVSSHIGQECQGITAQYRMTGRVMPTEASSYVGQMFKDWDNFWREFGVGDWCEGVVKGVVGMYVIVSVSFSFLLMPKICFLAPNTFNNPISNRGFSPPLPKEGSRYYRSH